jgi:hypothetical protein
MTQWTWDFQLIDDDGHVSSHIIARFDDERIEEIQARFAEFLRGCGYSVRDEDRPDVEELEDRIQAAMDYMHDRWDHKPQSVHDFRADLTNIMALLEGRTE